MVSKIKQALLAISITVIFAFFVFYGIWAFYKAPKYENFCNDSSIYPADKFRGAYPAEAYPSKPVPTQAVYENETACLEIGGKWTPRNYECPKCDCPEGWWTINEGDDFRTLKACSDGCYCPKGSCDPYYTCRTNFENASKKYERNVFIVSMILGVIAIIISLLIAIDSISIGFMAGGILVVIVALIRYWSELGDKLRFVILALVLIILIWIGYKKLNPKKQSQLFKHKSKET